MSGAVKDQVSDYVRQMRGDVERDWSIQVYAPDGKWQGFFRTRATAAAWVGKRTGFEITTRRPQKKSP